MLIGNTNVRWNVKVHHTDAYFGFHSMKQLMQNYDFPPTHPSPKCYASPSQGFDLSKLCTAASVAMEPRPGYREDI